MLEYLAALDDGIAKAREFAAANHAAEEAIAAMALASEDAAAVMDAAMGTATRAVHELRDAYLGASAAAQGLKGAGTDTGLGGAAAQAGLLQRELADISGDLIMQTALLREMAVALGIIQHDVADTSADLMMQTAVLREIRDLLLQSAGAATVLNSRIRDTGDATNKAGNSLRLWGPWWMQIGRLSGVALHGVISGLIEFLAVAIPATVAAGAWAAVWLQGATNVAQHMQAVYTATEATANIFHMTAGQAVGLGHALQTAQDAANPNVYQALGSAILLMNEKFGTLAQTGLTVGRIFDTFAAKLVYDFGPQGGLGDAMSAVLSKMVQDLVQFGQIIGNLGHALLKLGADMPGAANVLLGFLVIITKLIVAFSELPKGIIFAVFLLHELNTWGSVLVRTFGLMTAAELKASGGFFGLGRAAAILRAVMGVIPAIITAVGTAMVGFSGAVGVAGGALEAFGVELSAFIANLGTFGTLGVAAAVAGLGFLAFKLLTAKTAAQQFADALEAGITKSSNVQAIAAIGVAMGSLSQHLAATKTQLAGVSGQMQHTAVAGRYLAGYQGYLRQETGQLTAEQQKLAEQFAKTGAHAAALANQYHTSLIGALALADQAGVKLANTLTGPQWAMAQIKIASLVAGWRAMGAPMGAVGADINALAIQSGLAASKVDQLNQAWDQFMQNVTGGTSGLASFNQALTNLSTGSNKITSVLGKGGSVTLSVKDFAQSLTTFTGKGAAAWQNFDQVVGSTAPQLIDWFRTAGAEGAIGSKQFQQGILGMLSELTPLASKSKTAQAELLALAQQAGLGIHTFPQLQDAIKRTGASGKDLAKIVQEATVKMGNMAAVAQQLGTALHNDIINSMDAAKVSASGLSKDTLAYVQALRSGNTAAAQGGPLYNAVAADLKFLGYNGSQARHVIAMLTGQTDAASRSASTFARNLEAVRNFLAQLHSKTIQVNVNIAQHGGIHLPGMPTGVGITTYASGTDGASRGPAIVGEKGPELVFMRGGEHVVPAEHTEHLMKLAGHLGKVNAYAAGTGGGGSGGGPGGGGTHGKTKSLEQQLARELAVLAQKLLGASSSSGISQLVSNLLSTIKQLGSSGQIGKGEESRIVSMLHNDNKRLDQLFKERQKILNTIHKADQYAASVSQAAQSSASLSTIMGSAGNGPVSSAFLLASMKIDLQGIRKFDSDIKKLEKLGLDKALLNQIIQMGPVQGDQVAQALINGPLSNIKALNATESQVQAASKNLGRTSADRMFDTGKNAGKGFLTGLKSQEAEIEKLMKHLADTMVQTLRKELGIGGGGSGHHHKHHGKHSRHGHAIAGELMNGLAAGVYERLPGVETALAGAGHVRSALGTAASYGGRGGDIVINNKIMVPLPNSRQQYQTVQTQTLRVNRRNPTNNLSLVRGRG